MDGTCRIAAMPCQPGEGSGHPGGQSVGASGARLDTGPLLLRSPPGRRSPIHGYWLQSGKSCVPKNWIPHSHTHCGTERTIINVMSSSGTNLGIGLPASPLRPGRETPAKT